MFKKFFGQLQRIGKALMLPVAILPAAGLLLAFGSAMQTPNLVEIMPFLTNDTVVMISDLMQSAGSIYLIIYLCYSLWV